MQAYGKPFARVYDARWGAFTDSVAPKIEALFATAKAELKLPAVLLDLCCGTGNLAYYFLRKGYSVEGIDLSPAMIEYAVQRNQEFVNAGKASFSVQDAASFSIEHEVSFITCLYDALNHLPTMDAISSCIQSAFGSIGRRGMFLFDINTAKCLLAWNKVSIQEDEEIYLTTKSIYDPSMDRAYAQIMGFVRDHEGKYERYSETIYNLKLSTERILSIAKGVGFQTAYCADIQDLAVPVDDPESLKRAFFVCRKQ